MNFRTAFAVLISLSVGLNGCLAAIATAQINENQLRVGSEIRKLISDARSRHAVGVVVVRDGEYDLLPSLEGLIGLIDIAAAIELINYESGCGAEMWEYLKSPDFELVIDDFWGEPGILGVLEFMHTNGFELVYDLIGLMHLLMGLKLPDLPYTEEPLLNKMTVKQQQNSKRVLEDPECTPEDQAALAEIASRMVPIWKMLEKVLDLLATDDSFVALILRVREPDVIASYQSFILKDSALDLGRRMEAIGVPPKLVLGIWNVFFGLYDKP